MLWLAFCEHHRQVFGREYLDCTNEDEREYVIDFLYDTLVIYSREEIETALAHACRTLPPPRLTEEVIELMKQNIGKV